MVEEFLELVKIDSPSGKERQLAGAVKKKLLLMGLTVFEDEAKKAVNGNCGNLFAYLKGNCPAAPTLLFSAHLDRVKPGEGIRPLLQGGTLYSDGSTILAADDVAGIVQILEGIRHLQETSAPYGNIEILLTVGEEASLMGSRYVDPALLQAKIGYVLDGEGEVGTIINRAPAQENLTVTITGKAAHAGICPEKGINAVQVAARAISGMKLGRIDGETTANIGLISGGKAANIVCEEVVIACEARSLNPHKLEKQLKHMSQKFHNAARQSGAVVSLEKGPCYPAIYIGENEAPVALAVKAVQRLGLQPKVIGTGGGSDANILNGKGIPTVVLGVGYENIHSTKESMRVEQLPAGAGLVASLIECAGN